MKYWWSVEFNYSCQSKRFVLLYKQEREAKVKIDSVSKNVTYL